MCCVVPGSEGRLCDGLHPRGPHGPPSGVRPSRAFPATLTCAGGELVPGWLGVGLPVPALNHGLLANLWLLSPQSDFQ